MFSALVPLAFEKSDAVVKVVLNVTLSTDSSFVLVSRFRNNTLYKTLNRLDGYT